MRARHGQHFLRNRRAIERMLGRFDARAQQRVVEIGAGRGALTLPLSQIEGPFAAIEIDSVLAQDLARALGCPLLTAGAGGLAPAARRTLGRSGPLAGSGESAQPGSADGAHEPEGIDRFSKSPSMGTCSGAGDPGATERAQARAGSDRFSKSPPMGAPSGAGDPGAAPRFVIQADALEVRYEDLARLLGAGPEQRLRVIGNLPYAVATALVRRMLDERHLVSDALIMVQKEVADRMLALSGGKTYGLLSVLLALHAQRERVMTLEPGSFTPAPKVRSTVLALRFEPPLRNFAEADARLLALLKAAFSERRKKVAANLARHYGLDRATITRTLAACGAAPDARAEQIDPPTFARLAEALRAR